MSAFEKIYAEFEAADKAKVLRITSSNRNMPRPYLFAVLMQTASETTAKLLRERVITLAPEAKVEIKRFERSTGPVTTIEIMV